MTHVHIASAYLRWGLGAHTDIVYVQKCSNRLNQAAAKQRGPTRAFKSTLSNRVPSLGRWALDTFFGGPETLYQSLQSDLNVGD